MSKSKVVVITGVTSDSGRTMDYRLADLERKLIVAATCNRRSVQRQLLC